jgi:hypothetical protein
VRGLFVLALAGCINTSGLSGDDTIDDCTMAPADRACVTLHLHGDVGRIDSAQVDAQFELGGSTVVRRVISRGPAGGAVTPIAVGVVLTRNAGASVRFTVVARFGQLPVGIGTASTFDLAPTTHQQKDVTLTPTAQSRCFDGVKDGEERDVDCGGSECPACTLGQVCLTDTDCADSTCSAPSATTDYRCR